MTADFSSLSLPPAMQDNLKQLNYHTMTAIQAEALPLAMAGKDLIAEAKTGSGKTLAFALPLLLALNPRYFGVQALVLCPTRELSTQVANEMRRLARFQSNIKVVTLCGGQAIGPQIASLEHGAHVVVGTPGRIKDHLRKQTLDLAGVQTVVFDEADRMLDMGFLEDMEIIVGHTPKQRQTLLFSATFPRDIQQLSAAFQREPTHISVTDQQPAPDINERFIFADNDKFDALVTVLKHISVESAVVFCNTRQSVEDVARFLDSRRFNALPLHGDMEQRERDEAFTRFKHKSCCILVATDVAARGLDVAALPAVINFDLPRDPAVYTHRIGRTARAGETGLALSLLHSKERYKLDALPGAADRTVELETASDLSVADDTFEMLPDQVTLQISGGRKQKVRPGDILGALTAEGGVDGSQVGKIDIFDFSAYVSVNRQVAKQALQRLAKHKIKGRQFKARRLG